MPFLSIALEAQMTHNLIHLEHPVQKAGQTGTALSPYGVRRLAAAFARTQPICKSISVSRAPASRKLNTHPDLVFSGSTAMGGAGRVAGGAAVANQTSTAALASFRHRLLPTQRRAPRHFRALVAAAFRGGPFSNSCQRRIS